MSDVAATAPWARLSDENDLWYARFLLYLAHPPTYRSVNIAATGKPNPYPSPSAWHAAAKRFEWARRARAYDEAGRPPLTAPTEPATAT